MDRFTQIVPAAAVDVTRARRLAERRLHHVDCGTSGGIFGVERGYCLMIGGETAVMPGSD